MKEINYKNIKNKLFEYKWNLLTLFLAFIVISFIYTLQKIAPYGNNSMLDVDFYHQYGPFLNELRDRILQGKSLLYSYNVGGGIPFYRNFLNYLSSPFNIVLLLFKSKDIVMSFSIIIGLKTVFSSFFMSLYLSKTFKKSNVFVTAFSILYAFSGYFCAYYWNIMWLDGMVFLPLIMLGINRLVIDGKPIFYAVILAIMLFANYFIGYMICIYCVLYFIVLLFIKVKFNLKIYIKKTLYFILFSLLAAGLVSFALIPLFYSLSSISATKDSFPYLAFSFNPLDYLFNHLPGVSRTVFASDKLPLPNVYCGYITIIFIFSIFFNKEISYKVKMLTLSCVLFFFICFNLNICDFVWHAFHVPNDLPWRYSFLYVFSLVTLAYYASTKIDKLNIFKVSTCFAITLIVILLASKLDFENIDYNKCIVGVVLLICYYIIYVFYYKMHNKNKLLYKLLLLLFICIESIYCINCNWAINHDIKTFMKSKGPYKELINYAKKDENGLYRMEKTDYLTLNDGSWFFYEGMSTFTSMAYEDVSKFQRMFGLAGNNINSYYYKDYQTPVYNTMFNIKYLMGDYIVNDYYDKIYSKEGYNLIKYKYPSSIGYGVNNKINKWNLVSYDPFSNQRNFVYLATGIDNIYNPVNVSLVEGGKILEDYFYSNSNGNFNYELSDSSDTLTLYLDNKKYDNIYLYIGGSNIDSYNINGQYYSITSDEYYISDIGKKYEGLVKIDISIKDGAKNGSIYFYAYTLDDNKFKKYYNTLYNNKINVTKHTDTYINGNINLDDDKTIFTTLAYDKGFKVYIDDKKISTKKIANAYLGFNAPKGRHKVRIVYEPVYQKLGLIISLLSLLILIGFYKFNIKSIKKDKFIV